MRGYSTCKKIHTRNLDQREEVIFYKGQAVGPTGKTTSDLQGVLDLLPWCTLVGMLCQRKIKDARGNISM